MKVRRVGQLLSLIIVGGLFAVPTAAGQVEIVDGRASKGTVAKAFRLNFAIPDGPAFNLLEVDRSTILRPSTVRELSLAASEFTSGGTFTLPTSFGAELSPGLLIAGPQLSLADYNQKPWLYRIRLSAATQRPGEGEGPTAIAFGLRTSIIDESDVRANFTAAHQAILDTIHSIHVLAAKRRGNPALTSVNIVLTPEEIQEVERLSQRLKVEWADSLWNESAFDVAFAVRATAEDSVGNDMRVDQWAFWTTYGIGVGDWGQLLVGAKGGSIRDTQSGAFSASGSFSSFSYYGSNRYKGFAELQGRWNEAGAPAWLVNVGAEAVIRGEFWLGLAAGLEFDETTGDTGLEADFALKLGLL